MHRQALGHHPSRLRRDGRCNVSGLYGGGIYTVAEYGTETWEKPIVIDSFTNHN